MRGAQEVGTTATIVIGRKVVAGIIKVPIFRAFTILPKNGLDGQNTIARLGRSMHSTGSVGNRLSVADCVMMRKIAFTIVLLVVAVGGAFYYFSGREYVFRFSEDQLQEKLNTKLPLTKTYLRIFQVTLDNPRINLTNGSSRVRAGLDVTLNIRIADERKPLGGHLDVSGGVKYVPERAEFFLTDPVIERIAIKGIPARYVDKVNGALTKALGDYYADRPIYTLRATDLKHAAARLVLQDFVIESGELVVTLGI